MEYVTKITANSVGLTPATLKPVVKDSSGPVPVMRVFGRIMGRKSGSTQYGEYTKYSGEFQATNLLNEKKFRSDTLIMPGISADMLSDIVASAPKDVTKETPIEFGVDVTAQKHEYGDELKHKWGVKPLMEVKGSTALDALEAKLLKALPKK